MALVHTPKSPIMPLRSSRIAKSKSKLIRFCPKTKKLEDSKNISSNSTKRRSSRQIKKPNLFKITHDRRPDPELSAALKRSKLDITNQEIDYSSISSVPIVYATKEEFNNPVKLWNKYTRLGEEYGAIKVIPPEGYSTKLPMDLETFEFKVRQQRVELLSNGNGFSYPSQFWNCDKMRRYGKWLKKEIMNCEDPSLESIEREYWKMVRKSDTRVITYYGSDLNMFSTENKTKYGLLLNIADNDPWNLYNLPKCDGSLLKYIKTEIPGINSPWLYIGMIFTSFCWHTEDNYFGSVNYHHLGAPKVWYVIPPTKASKMESILKDYSSLQGEEFALYGLRVQIPPDIIMSNDITLHRIVQEENQFVLVWPRTFHCGFNAGFNCNEACNIAPGNWIKMGYQSLLNYKYARKTCIPFFRILLSSLPNIMELEWSHIESIMECLSRLIIEEYNLRVRIPFPHYQMYFDPQIVERLPEINQLLTQVDKRDFDKSLFISSLYKSDTLNHYQYLVACKEMADFCIKDCDLCDSPTLGSAIMCNHINTIVCVACMKYHECDCRTKVLLYRFPLHMFYTIVMILKKLHLSLKRENWEFKDESRMPSEEQIVKIDSQAYFAFRNFHESNCSINEELQKYDHWLPNSINSRFEDITGVIRKLNTGRWVYRSRKDHSNDIVIRDCESLESFEEDRLSFENIIHVTKLTVKYTILALEEDQKESVS